MAILEKEVLARWNPNNKKHFELKGYKFTKCNDEFSVKINDLSKGAHNKVTKICDICGTHVPNIKFKAIIHERNKGDGLNRCKDCGKEQVWISRLNNFKYEKSVEYYSKNNSMKYLIDEWSIKNKQSPKEMSYGSEQVVLWNCPNCKSEYGMEICNRTSNKSNCPYCRGFRVNETNCLWSTHPAVAVLLHNKEDGYKFTHGSHEKLEFKCDNCQHKEYKKICKVVNKGFFCSRCSDHISYPEKFMMNLLEQLGVDYKYNLPFKWSDNKRYDFYISSNCIVETHGKQHYEESPRGRSLIEEQENDNYKKEIALKNEIKHYIIIDCRYSEMEWIREKILNSELNNLFELSNIDWLKCHKFALNSLIIMACDLWNNGIKSTIEIGNVLKLNNGTICGYLKKASEIGICDYNPHKIAQDTRNIFVNKYGGSNAKKVLQLSIENEEIKEWLSVTEAALSLNINISNVSSVCSGKRETVGGFKWMYKEDYDKLMGANT